VRKRLAPVFLAVGFFAAVGLYVAFLVAANYGVDFKLP
jgi:hypothetical protein